jgi:hypothetical protein
MKQGMVTYTIQLGDGSIGYVTSANEPKLGYEMTITVRDENGNDIQVTNIVDKVIKVKAPWQ